MVIEGTERLVGWPVADVFTLVVYVSDNGLGDHALLDSLARLAGDVTQDEIKAYVAYYKGKGVSKEQARRLNKLLQVWYRGNVKPMRKILQRDLKVRLERDDETK